MTIRVDRDGKIVPIIQGTASVAGKDVPLGFGEVTSAGRLLRDDQVEPDTLERIKAGDVAGLSWHESDDPGPPPGAFEPEPSGTDARGLGPSADGDDGGASSDPDLYDPSDHNQEEVLEYLKTADEAEAARVKDVESQGKGRQGIADYKPSS